MKNVLSPISVAITIARECSVAYAKWPSWRFAAAASVVDSVDVMIFGC